MPRKSLTAKRNSSGDGKSRRFATTTTSRNEIVSGPIIYGPHSLFAGHLEWDKTINREQTF